MSEEIPDETPSAPEGWVDESVETSWVTDGPEESATVDDVVTTTDPEELVDAVEVTPDVELDEPAAYEDPEPEPVAREARESPESTGHASVDQVLASLDALDQASVHDHVAVFEEAHRALRRTLDEAHDEPAAGLG